MLLPAGVHGARWVRCERDQIIQNIKKSPERRGRPEWFYKERDLQQAAAELRAALNPAWLRSATIVAVPPHVVKGDPLHDDRVLQIATLMGAGAKTDVRELIESTIVTTWGGLLTKEWSVHSLQEVTRASQQPVAADDPDFHLRLLPRLQE